MTAYVTTEAIIIPKGTPVGVEPSGRKQRIFVPFASISIAVTKDTTASWEMPLSEALEDGLIKEAEAA